MARITGSLNINVMLAFVFGVVFVSVMLGFAVFVSSPSEFAQTVFIIVVGLAAAGVAAVIPGMLDINLPYAKAGGALAVFLLIYTTKPAIVGKIANFAFPTVSGEETTKSYLRAVDDKKITEAWSYFTDSAKQAFVKTADDYEKLYNATRYRLGSVLDRKLVGTFDATSPPGVPPGAYRAMNYQTRFEGGSCFQEIVTLVSSDGKNWGVFGHVIDNTVRACI